MPSASITGKPESAETTNGIVALTPPASIGITASNFFLMISSAFLKACNVAGPFGTFSTNTVGAPIERTLHTKISSSISDGLRILIVFPCSS